MVLDSPDGLTPSPCRAGKIATHMSVLFGSLRRRLFGITPGATSFESRGFRGGTPDIRSRLEEVGRAFTLGYHAALAAPNPELLPEFIAQGPKAFRGFAYEGAGMGLALVDWMTPWSRTRLTRFLSGAGDAHVYMVHVGAGWVLARVPGNVDRFLSRFDPLLRWLLIDGYGFHEGYFNWAAYLGGAPAPSRLKGYARRVFDQGLGRCLWFIDGAEVRRITQTIAGFPAPRQADLWSGIGLASVYAGEISEEDLHLLRAAAGDFLPQLSQGAAFAAKARQRAGNLSPYQDLACGILCGMTASEAARVTDDVLENLPNDGPEPAYETWRQRTQEAISRMPRSQPPRVPEVIR